MELISRLNKKVYSFMFFSIRIYLFKMVKKLNIIDDSKFIILMITKYNFELKPTRIFIIPKYEK